MKNLHTIATLVFATLVAHNATGAEKTLTVPDVTAAGQQSEHDKNALRSLRDKPISLVITKREKDEYYFDTPTDPGITVACNAGAKINSGKITATIDSFDLDFDNGHEQINVLKLRNCQKAR